MLTGHARTAGGHNVAPTDSRAVSPRRGVPRGVLILQGATGALVLIYLASTILRAPGIVDPLLRRLGQQPRVCRLRTAAVAGARSPDAADGGAGGRSACGLLFFTAGSVLWTTLVQHFTPVSRTPRSRTSASWPIIRWRSWGSACLIRETVPNTSRIIWVDGLIAALGVAALEATLVLGPIIHARHRRLRNRGDEHRLSDRGSRPVQHGRRGLRRAGLATRPSLVDPRCGPRGFCRGRQSIYLLRVTSGTFVTGTPLDSLWPIAAFLMATRRVAGHGRSRQRHPGWFRRRTSFRCCFS